MQKVRQSYVAVALAPFGTFTAPSPHGRSLVRQVDPAKMQIFVKYMRVKIVVLHYPFNWICREDCTKTYTEKGVGKAYG